MTHPPQIDTNLTRQIRACATDATIPPISLNRRLLHPCATCRISDNIGTPNAQPALIVYDDAAALYLIVRRTAIDSPYFVCHAHAGWARLQELLELTWIAEVKRWADALPRTCWRCSHPFDPSTAEVGGDICNMCWERTKAAIQLDTMRLQIEALRQQLDVYRYALALAAGEVEVDATAGTAADWLGIAQDELGHGRWLDTEAHNG